LIEIKYDGYEVLVKRKRHPLAFITSESTRYRFE